VAHIGRPIGELERAVIRAAQGWDAIGKVKAMHVLTCTDCERLESEQDRWCDEAAAIGRRHIEAARKIHEALVALAKDTDGGA